MAVRMSTIEAPPATAWRVICDFDGTIAQYDTTDALLEQFAHPAWRGVEAEWVAGRITSALCMRAQVALLDVSRAELDAWIADIAIDPAFAHFVDFCAKKQIDLCIASDGIDYVIAGVLARHGLGHLRVSANRLVFVGERGYKLWSHDDLQRCKSGLGMCKCQLLNTTDLNTADNVLYIGDGRSDFCVSGKVTQVLAKSALLDYCRQKNLPHQPFDDFAHAQTIFADLLRRDTIQNAA